MIQNENQMIKNENQMIKKERQMIQNEKQMIKNEKEVIKNEKEVIESESRITPNCGLGFQSNEKSEKCPICLLSFVQKCSLDAHRKIVHENAKFYHCNFCQKTIKLTN